MCDKVLLCTNESFMKKSKTASVIDQVAPVLLNTVKMDYLFWGNVKCGLTLGMRGNCLLLLLYVDLEVHKSLYIYYTEFLL